MSSFSTFFLPRTHFPTESSGSSSPPAAHTYHRPHLSPLALLLNILNAHRMVTKAALSPRLLSSPQHSPHRPPIQDNTNLDGGISITSPMPLLTSHLALQAPLQSPISSPKPLISKDPSTILQANTSGLSKENTIIHGVLHEFSFLSSRQLFARCTWRVPQPMRVIHKSLSLDDTCLDLLILTSLRCRVQTPSGNNQSNLPSHPHLLPLSSNSATGPTELKATPPSCLPRLHSFTPTSHPPPAPDSPANVATSQSATSYVYTITPGSTPSLTAVLFSSRS